ncbi:hypothetical protein Tco_0762495 [Tanacetum coccineum]
MVRRENTRSHSDLDMWNCPAPYVLRLFGRHGPIPPGLGLPSSLEEPYEAKAPHASFNGQQGCVAALETLAVDMEAGEKTALMKKAYNTLILCLGDRVLREVTKETAAARI